MSTRNMQGVVSPVIPASIAGGSNYSGVYTLDQLNRLNAIYPNHIGNSLRFRSSASAYLNRTFGTPTNNKIWTYSIWVKRGTLGAEQELLNANSNASQFYFSSTNTLNFYDATSGAAYYSTQVFRDPSSWYHILVSVDTTQATAGNRVRIYVNGSQVTAFSTGTAPTQNNASAFNIASTIHVIGRYNPTAINYYDGYLAEVNFIDGQALTPSAFGKFYYETGVWCPSKYTGTYGTNGFYLKFTDTTSTTTLGYDSSGNGNNWTTNNISLTAGSTYDWMLDSPTPFQGSSYGVGNYCVLNSANISSAASLAEANLSVSGTSSNYASSQSTFNLTSGKWYFEMVKATSTANVDGLGLVVSNYNKNSTSIGDTGSYVISDANPSQIVTKSNGAAGVIVSTTNWANGDIIQCAYDAGTGNVWFGRNGSWYPATNGGTVGDPAAGTNPTITAVSGLTPIIITYSTGSTNKANFGQRPFAFSPPSGYKSLCTYNLPTPTIQNGAGYMAATLYTGTGAAQNISNAVNGVSFQPDFVWTKSRTNTNYHNLMDSVRGTNKDLYSNITAAEDTNAQIYTALNSNGFSVGTDSSANQAANTFVGWQWKAGGTAVTNTAGSITSSVSANTTSGFSVVSFNSGSAGAKTVGHGLGVTPSMIIMKVRSAVGAWYVWNTNLASSASAFLVLNTTAAVGSDAALWNNTNPTSSVFSFTSNYYPAANQDVVAYCFAAIPGYSAFGSYTGNGSSDGPFVYCGFRPRYVMYKNASVGSAGYDWVIIDSSRSTYNTALAMLDANLSSAENGNANGIDILSNGFKLRDSGAAGNGSGNTIIYACFAENPFTNALAR